LYYCILCKAIVKIKIKIKIRIKTLRQHPPQGVLLKLRYALASLASLALAFLFLACASRLRPRGQSEYKLRATVAMREKVALGQKGKSCATPLPLAYVRLRA